MKNKLLTLTLALFLPLVSAGQQSLSAFLLTSGPYADPATLICTLDDVGGIGFVAAGANGVTVQRVGAISPFPSCHNVFTTTVLPASVPRMESEPLVERLIEQASYSALGGPFADENLLSVPCNQ